MQFSHRSECVQGEPSKQTSSIAYSAPVVLFSSEPKFHSLHRLSVTECCKIHGGASELCRERGYGFLLVFHCIRGDIGSQDAQAQQRQLPADSPKRKASGEAPAKAGPGSVNPKTLLNPKTAAPQPPLPSKGQVAQAQKLQPARGQQPPIPSKGQVNGRLNTMLNTGHLNPKPAKWKLYLLWLCMEWAHNLPQDKCQQCSFTPVLSLCTYCGCLSACQSSHSRAFLESLLETFIIKLFQTLTQGLLINALPLLHQVSQAQSLQAVRAGAATAGGSAAAVTKPASQPPIPSSAQVIRKSSCASWFRIF